MPRINLVQRPPVAGITSEPVAPIWLNWFNSVYRLLGLAPTIYTGIIAPTSIPNKIGDTYIDTALGKVYVSVGISSSADWKILN